MAKLSFKQRERQRREEEILRVAAQLMRERGYANLNMDDIAEEVGVSKPTLYQHFKSKDDMVAATMSKAMDDMDEFMRSLEGKAPIVQLELILRHLLGNHVSPDGIPLNTVSSNKLIELTANDDYAGRHREAGLHLDRIVKAGQADGSINPALPPMVVISALFSMLSMLRGPEIMQIPNTDMHALIEHTVTVFLNGIRPPC